MRCANPWRFLLLTVLSPQLATAEWPPAVDTFLKQNCYQCHDADSQEGGLDLTQLVLNKSAAKKEQYVVANDRTRIMKICVLKISVAWLTATCICLSSSSLAAQPPPPSSQAKAKQGGRSAKAARRAAEGEMRQSEPAPTFADVSYGLDASNKIDFWKANGTAPTPLVVFIHGGGFRRGDKTEHNASLLKACLDSGISYASINYRLSD